jgi:hypothetical protein
MAVRVCVLILTLVGIAGFVTKSSLWAAADEQVGTGKPDDRLTSLAKKAYLSLREIRDVRPEALETLYTWSLRWMQAESQVASPGQIDVTAAKAHLERMKEMQERMAANALRPPQAGDVSHGAGTRASIDAAAYYVADAERLVAEALKNMPHQHDRGR